MIDRRTRFLAWLITAVTDKCRDMDGVRRMNEEIRRHSAGLASEPEKPDTQTAAN